MDAGDAVRDLPVIDLKGAAGLRGWLLCARMRVCAPSMRAFFRRISTSDSGRSPNTPSRRRIEAREVGSRPSRIFMRAWWVFSVRQNSAVSAWRKLEKTESFFFFKKRDLDDGGSCVVNCAMEMSVGGG